MESLILAVTMACSLGAAAPAVAAQTSKAAQTKAEYVEKARVELDELSVKIDALEVKAKAAGASAKAGLDKRLVELKARRKTTKRDFLKLKRATGKAWVSFKAGVDNGIADLKRTYDDAAKD
jgi:hypothetical protein